MCCTHTIFHSACGHFSKAQIFGEPCIRAASSQGYSSGCWDTTDMGTDSEDTLCRSCMMPRSRSSSFSSTYSADASSFREAATSSMTDVSTLFSFPHVETISTDCAVVDGEGKYGSGIGVKRKTAKFLTVPAGESTSHEIMRRDSAINIPSPIWSTSSRRSSTSSSMSVKSTSDCARELRAQLPNNVHSCTVVRNESGIGVCSIMVREAH